VGVLLSKLGGDCKVASCRERHCSRMVQTKENSATPLRVVPGKGGDYEVCGGAFYCACDKWTVRYLKGSIPLGQRGSIPLPGTEVIGMCLCLIALHIEPPRIAKLVLASSANPLQENGSQSYCVHTGWFVIILQIMLHECQT
jgi:hypothetical protein